MTGNVRRLTFDYGHLWFWPLAISVALISDFDFLHRPDYAGSFIGGMMLALQGTFSAPKVPLWRTLPVTDADIGRARWWQLMGLPALALLAAMALAALLHLLLGATGGGRHLPEASVILGSLVGQFFYPVLLTLFTLAITVARTTRSPLAFLATVALGCAYLASLRLPVLFPYLSQGARALWLGGATLLTAAVLYVTAPGWPQPVVQPIQIDTGMRGSSAGGGHKAGHGGWTALCGMALGRTALVLALVMALWAGLILALDLHHVLIMQFQLFIPVIVLTLITQLNATALRALRILPGTRLRLTAYLFLLPLAFVAAALCVFSLMLEPRLAQTAPKIDVVALSAAVLGSALVLPAALSVRQAAMGLVLTFCMIPVPLIEFGWDYMPPPWRDDRLLAGLAALAIGGGFFWMYRQISRGTQVYRLQPFMAARWRGKY
jgi:hypothetical protein